MINGTLKINRKVLHNGIEITLGRKDYFITYPAAIWKEFPDVFCQTFADSLTYFLTMHLSLSNGHRILYNFPPPITEPFFFKGMVYSLSENYLTADNKSKMADLLKLLYNRDFQIEFTGRPRYTRFKNVNRNSKKRAVIPFSFGKDSLLTFALADELGIKPYLIFFREPRSPHENRHKYKLAQRFFDEFDIDVHFFPLAPGWLREVDTDNTWGWGLQLTQYTLLTIPYLFGLKSKYLFWAHEQSCNDTFVNGEGFILNPVYEQSYNWVLTSNATAKVLGSNAIFASLLEPIHELAIIKILHSRYPDIAKYQTSCFAEEDIARSRRWCGVCTKCARMYVMFLAHGISPSKVSFFENMLTPKKRHLYPIFEQDLVKNDSAYAKSAAAKEEQLFSFYLAAKRGAKGPLMDEFKKKYFKAVKKKEKSLREKYFGIHTSNTLTYELKTPILKIFEEELSDLR